MAIETLPVLAQLVVKLVPSIFRLKCSENFTLSFYFSTLTVVILFLLSLIDIADSGLLVQHEKEVCVPVNIGKTLYLQLMQVHLSAYLFSSTYLCMMMICLYNHRK